MTFGQVDYVQARLILMIPIETKLVHLASRTKFVNGKVKSKTLNHFTATT
jgi:hypothetical protein